MSRKKFCISTGEPVRWRDIAKSAIKDLAPLQEEIETMKVSWHLERADLKTRLHIEKEDNEQLRNEVKAHMGRLADKESENAELKAECNAIIAQRTFYMQSYDRLCGEEEKRNEYISQLEYANGLLMNYLADEHEAHELANNVIKNKDKHIEMLNRWRADSNKKLEWSNGRDKLRIKALNNAIAHKDGDIALLTTRLKGLENTLNTRAEFIVTQEQEIADLKGEIASLKTTYGIAK